MLSKNNIKFIKQLQTKKFRNKYNKFIIEGNKIVSELLESELEVNQIITTNNALTTEKSEIILTSNEEIKKISTLSTPQDIIAIANIPNYSYEKSEIIKELSLVLDDLQDPGNLGTIIRIADWFGIKNIFCSKNTVDAYNPKVVQASMGAIFRVKIHYVNLEELFKEYSNINNFTIFGTFLEGENIYNNPLANYGFIILGNESKGINNQFEKYINIKIHIPTFSAHNFKTESLNVATATSIVCSEFKRRKTMVKQ